MAVYETFLIGDILNRFYYLVLYYGHFKCFESLIVLNMRRHGIVKIVNPKSGFAKFFEF